MNGVIVSGKASAEPVAASLLFALALALADHARSAGMRLMTLRRSRHSGSFSCYLTLRDSIDRLWVVRVSDHRCPREMAFPKPHLDLVIQDGASGLDAAKTALTSIADGSYDWHDAEATVRMPRPRRRAR